MDRHFPVGQHDRTKWTRHGKRDSIPDEGDVGRRQRFCGGCPFLLWLVVLVRSVLAGDSLPCRSQSRERARAGRPAIRHHRFAARVQPSTTGLPDHPGRQFARDRDTRKKTRTSTQCLTRDIAKRSPTLPRRNWQQNRSGWAKFTDRNHFAANELGAVVFVRRPWPPGIAMDVLVIDRRDCDPERVTKIRSDLAAT
jgi:hypothetical protein